MKKVLVTGAGGFVGTHLVKYLEGKRIEVMKHTHERDGDIIRFRKDLLHGVDTVFHLASTVHNYHILDKPYLDAETNCKGTIALLEAIRVVSTDIKLVYVSTFFVNDGEPKALYGATKLCAEHICKAYGNVYGINTSIARPSNVYGVGDYMDNNKKSAFSRMIAMACDGKEIQLYEENKRQSRDYLYVTDLITALETLALKGEPNKVYEVGSGDSHLVLHLVESIIAEAGSGSYKFVKAPKFHEQVGIKNWYSNIYELRQLGWEPQICLIEGIRKVIKEYKNEN